MERRRVKHPVERRRFAPVARLGLVLGGTAMIAVGGVLLVTGTPGVQRHLGRIAAILIILGLVVLAGGLIGHL